MQTITIQATDGHSLEAYVSLPAGNAKAPGLVLLQYICGVNRVMRSLADGYAAQGYIVVVPDLFARQEPGIALIDDPSRPDPVEQARALQLNANFDNNAAVLDLQATVDTLRRHPRCDGRVGALGYCLGGRMAYLMATRTDVDCSVGYYAVNLENFLEEAEHIRHPLMLHMAAEDMLVPEHARLQICARLQPLPKVDLQVHAGVNHAFALPGGPNHHPEVAARANLASAQFLARHLPNAAPVGL